MTDTDDLANRLYGAEQWLILDGAEEHAKAVAEAADIIDTLAAENAALREALEPFAEIARDIAENRPGWDHDGFILTAPGWPYQVSLAPFRRARAVLKGERT